MGGGVGWGGRAVGGGWGGESGGVVWGGGMRAGGGCSVCTMPFKSHTVTLFNKNPIPCTLPRSGRKHLIKCQPLIQPLDCGLK